MSSQTSEKFVAQPVGDSPVALQMIREDAIKLAERPDSWQRPSVPFDEWIEGTLWFVAAP